MLVVGGVELRLASLKGGGELCYDGQWRDQRGVRRMLHERMDEWVIKGAKDEGQE
jgi:hypothetical protein